MPPIAVIPAIRRLPLELFIEIFLAAKDLHGLDDARPGPPPCTYLSHVCHSWRAAAMTCQQLWSSVLRPHLNWTKLCLERCHFLPVEIVVNPKNGFEQESETYRTLLPALSRAHTITIDYREDHPTGFSIEDPTLTAILKCLLFDWLGFSALRDFQIHLPTSDDSYMVLYEDLIISDSLASNLSSIAVSCCMLRSPMSDICSKVHTLILEDVIPWNDCDELAGILGSLVFLTVFEYRWTQDHFDGDSVSRGSEVLNRSPVPLRNLDRLVLSGFFKEDICIFGALKLHPTADVTIASRTSHTWELDASLSEEEVSNPDLKLFAHFAKQTLMRHLDVALEHGWCICHATVTGHSVQLTLEEGVDDDAWSLAEDASPNVSSIAIDISPFSTSERRDIVINELFSVGLARYDIPFISYAGCLFIPDISADLICRALTLREITLVSEEDVIAFCFCTYSTHFPELRFLNMECDLSRPAERLQGIFDVMHAVDVTTWSRVQMSWTPTSGTRDISIFSPEVRWILMYADSGLD